MTITTTYSRSRFLADLTLGFSDGLTVPFALTAGVSSLGKTETVIYAGLAEVCAGCLSMGVGGFLASRGELVDAHEAQEARYATLCDEDQSRGDSSRASDDIEKGFLSDGSTSKELERKFIPSEECVTDVAKQHVDVVENFSSPILTGFSIAFGYILGGFLPLIPYFFVDKVSDGLMWSTISCIMALFFFGVGKRFISTGKLKGRVRRCLWEGVQMAVLGGLAAGAAVLCVQVLRGTV